MGTTEDAQALLERAFGHESSFRPGQLEAILALADDRARVLVVQRTGWGKSVVYFLATALLRAQGLGPTILISPLLALMREGLPPSVPLLATTATANDRVVADVTAQLGPDIRIVRGPLGRDSLHLQVLQLPSQAERLAWLAEYLPSVKGSGIIYVLTHADAARVSGWLRRCGIDAPAYTGGDDHNGARRELEQRLFDDDVKALVATVALGMGFDKPNVGFVVHFQRPGSPIAYYQQIGRAGRALDRAEVVLLAGEEDDEIADYFIESAFPPEQDLRDVLAALERVEQASEADLEQHLNLHRNAISRALKVLEVDGAVVRGRLGPSCTAGARRDRLVYAMSQAAIVVAAAAKSGGTWAGAIESIKHRWVPVYVRANGDAGSRELALAGAHPLPPGPVAEINVQSLFDGREPSPPQATEDADTVEGSAYNTSPAARLELNGHRDPAARHLSPESPRAASPGSPEQPAYTGPCDAFWAVWPLLNAYLHEPRGERDVAEALSLQPAQARIWLTRAVEEGLVKVKKRPRKVYMAGDGKRDQLTLG